MLKRRGIIKLAKGVRLTTASVDSRVSTSEACAWGLLGDLAVPKDRPKLRS